ncbi:endonuclease/exonuclease/phosphatase family protein [Homoserinibacter sp. YIM 151385]|uniref:endonuclease/exonuclease/phosphatase family protein n=1 Tax=Homoserinibacter sp. YIM 151385 TaxID=2985506 RepID=UPI0022F09C87|nr:endonuclease/exonuclease/phosphatase family protein [Homoserinibacter sp. YIM 151385]WBU38145.1 endonuclease/exonuclease/phosphatase family protein [Homoserinibacter sp. YIM 151385]
MLRRLLAAAFVLLAAAALLLIAWPQLLSLERLPLVAQIVSLRAALAGGGLVLLLVVAILAIAVRRSRIVTGPLALLLALFVALNAGVLALRGADQSPLAAEEEGDLTVMVWNTLGDEPGAEAIARLALDSGADIVVLPETSRGTAEEAAAVMAAEGRTMDARSLWYDEIAIARTTSLLISTELGPYERDAEAGETRTLPSFVMRPVDGTGPTIVAAHPVAPVPGEMSAWRQGLSWLADRCAEPDTIVAGDLNSTLDHYTSLGEGGGDLGTCRDAARAAGSGAVGTWPTDAPALLGAPIDHVLVSEGWEVRDVEVVTSLDGAGSDHRPVLARLHPTG